MRLATVLVTLALACSGTRSLGDVGIFSDLVQDAEPGLDATGQPACGGPYTEPPAHILFDLSKTPVESPFPYDYFLAEDGHIRIDEDAFSSNMLPFVSTEAAYRLAFAEAKKFADYAPVAFLTTVAVDPSSLPADGAASLAEDASVRLHKLDAEGRPLERVAIRCSVHDFDDGVHMVSLYPLYSLQPNTRYLLSVTDRLRSTDGTAFGMSAGFARLMCRAPIDDAAPRAALEKAERSRLSPVVNALPDADRVIAAADFTTGSVLDDTDRAFAPLRKGPGQATIPFDLDLDDDGQVDAVPGKDFEDCPDETIGYGLVGHFEPLNFTGPDRHFHAEGSAFKTYPQPPVEFWLMVPAGTGPFPVVLLGHGINATHKQHCQLARKMAAKGLATLRFDWPRHGDRGSGAMDFLTLPDPYGVRDNFRQAAVDLGSAVLMVEAMAEVLDAAPLGAPDGKPELDGSRIGYLGHSLGGIIGMLYLPFSDRVKVAVINEASVGLFHLVDVYLFKSINLFGPMGYVHAAPHLLWAADGMSFVRAVRRDPFHWASGPCELLVQELVGDETVPNAATEALARNVGIPLIEPVIVAVEGLDVVPASGATSGLTQWQAEGAVHSDFTGNGPLTKQMHDQAIEYLRSGLYEGNPRVIYGSSITR